MDYWNNYSSGIKYHSKGFCSRIKSDSWTCAQASYTLVHAEGEAWGWWRSHPEAPSIVDSLAASSDQPDCKYRCML